MKAGSSDEKNEQQTTISGQANSTFDEFRFGESVDDLFAYSSIDEELNLSSLNLTYTPDSDLNLPGSLTFCFDFSF